MSVLLSSRAARALLLWPMLGALSAGVAGQEPESIDAVAERRAAVRPGSPEEGEQRLALACELLRVGRHAEAAVELWWCFDQGHRRNRAFWGTRLGGVLDALGEVAAVHAQTRTELVRRRDRKEAEVLAGALGNGDVAELLAMNEVLADTARSVRTYDALVARHARDQLAFFYAGIRAALWQDKRYRALVDGCPDAARRLSTASLALREASRRLVGRELRPDPIFVARVVADTCIDVEARLALGEKEEGDQLADALIAFAPGGLTVARLIAHAERAGAEETEARLSRDALRGLDAAAKVEFAKVVADARAELAVRAAGRAHGGVLVGR